MATIKTRNGGDTKAEAAKGILQKMLREMGGEELLGTISVRREGTQIILPPEMDYDEAITWLQRKRDEEEKVVRYSHEFTCVPLDGLAAFHRALARVYGWTDLRPTPGFWGSAPPAMVPIATSADETIMVPYGAVSVPGIDEPLNTSMKFHPVPRFLIAGQTRAKHLPKIKSIADAVKIELRERSLYKGKAVRLSFEWQREEEDYDPVEHAPKFMNLMNVGADDLVFSADLSIQVEVGLLVPLMYPDAMRKSQESLRRTVLLEGTYGVGKTLTALVAARVATDHGWTVLYADSVDDLLDVLKIAPLYSPSLVIVEDIDRRLGGGRTADMDAVLNQLDGLDTKGTDVMVLFTTNNVRALNKAALRPGGRVDVVISLSTPDAEAATVLVRKYGASLLAPEVDLDDVGRELTGRLPAEIREVVGRSKMYALRRLQGADITGSVTGEDLVHAARGTAAHAALLRDDPPMFVLADEAEIVMRHEDVKALVRSAASSRVNGSQDE